MRAEPASCLQEKPSLPADSAKPQLGKDAMESEALKRSPTDDGALEFVLDMEESWRPW